MTMGCRVLQITTFFCRALKDCHLTIEEDFNLETSFQFFSPDYKMPAPSEEAKADEELPDYQGDNQAFDQYLDYD